MVGQGEIRLENTGLVDDVDHRQRAMNGKQGDQS